MMNTDPYTIQFIESRVPALSKSDFKDLQASMKSGQLFSAVTDSQMRAEITQRLLAMDELIPSLHTLISNIRYLKKLAKLLDALLPPKAKRRTKRRKKTQAALWTLRQRFYSHYTKRGSSNSIEIQQSLVSYPTIPMVGLNAFELSYQMLWLCSYRVCWYPNAYGILQLATLAKRLGFSSVEIDREVKEDPDKAVIAKVIDEVLMILRPNEKFDYDADQAAPIVKAFNDYLDKILTAPLPAKLPYVTVAGRGEPLDRRCGYGSVDAKDLNHLFLDTIHCSLQAYPKGGEEISSFYVKRSRHIAFFGALNLEVSQSAHSPLSSTIIAPRERGITLPESASVQPEQLPSPRRASPHHAAQGQVVQSIGPVVAFIENNVTIRKIPFEKDRINSQAREYADQGKKLHVPEGPHFIWEHCFDILTRTRCSTVLVTTVAFLKIYFFNIFKIKIYIYY